MDRDELQDRIRARRSGGDPYRRGAVPDGGAGGYERFEPEADDSRARREARAADPRRDEYVDEAPAVPVPPPVERADLTREPDEWPSAEAPAEPAYVDERVAAPEAADRYEAPYEPQDGAEYDDEPGVYPYEYARWEDREPRSSGAGAFAILGFLALGVLALLGGAVLAGVFSDDPGVAEASPTPSVSASVAPEVSAAPSQAPSADTSAAPGSSSEPGEVGEPVVFPDGATFEVQACASNEMSFSGCAQTAEFFSGGAFVVWVGFSDATGNDTLLLVLRQGGAAVADSEFVLGDSPFSCTSDCTGYARQGFTGLPPGEYEVELLRNGELAHRITIGVD